MRYKFDFCSKGMKTTQTTKITIICWCCSSQQCWQLFHFKVMPSFSVLNHYNNNLLFTLWIMFWNISRIYIYIFLRAIVTLFFIKFFQLSLSDGKFVPSQLFFFMKGLMLVILWECFPISSLFNATAIAYCKPL